MRIVRYRGADGPAWGVGEADRVLATTGMPFVDLAVEEEVGKLSALELLAPVTPSKVICVGRNLGVLFRWVSDEAFLVNLGSRDEVY